LLCQKKPGLMKRGEGRGAVSYSRKTERMGETNANAGGGWRGGDEVSELSRVKRRGGLEQYTLLPNMGTWLGTGIISKGSRALSGRGGQGVWVSPAVNN